MEVRIFAFVTFLVVVYFATFFCVIKFKKNTRFKSDKFPHLTMQKDKIIFNSLLCHKLKVANVKVEQISDNLYLRTNDCLVIISNVGNVEIYNGFLYFRAKGKVEISVDLKSIYRYFAIKIKSQQFDLEAIKQQVILDFLNNNFDLNFSKLVKKYINFIEKVLNINIFEEKIIVKPNKYRFLFELTYKVNNRIKRINVC